MKLRLAEQSDLPYLKIMFQKIIAQMDNNGIKIWNEFYPYEEFEGDIKAGNLYLITTGGTIVAAFGLYHSITGQDCFEWKDINAPALYLGRLGVNSDFLRKGIGSLILDYAQKIAVKNKASFVRLLVSDKNIPAIKLYEKNGYIKVPGIFEEFSMASNKKIIEFGFEKEVCPIK